MSLIERLVTKTGPRAINLVLAGLILIIAALVYFSYSTSMTYTAGDSGVTITYRTFPLLPQSTIQLTYAEIESVQVFDKAPAMHKTLGFDAIRIKAGTFQSKELGTFKAYVRNASKPLVLIRTKEQAYMISPDDAHAMQQTIEAGKAK